MLADPRGGAAGRGRRLGQAGDRSDLPQRAEIRVVDPPDVSVVDQIGVVERLARRQIGLRGDVTVAVEDLHPLVRGPLAHALQDEVARGLDRLVVPGPRGFLEARLRQHLGQKLEGVEEGQEEVFQQVPALDPAVVGGQHRVVVQGRHVAAQRRQAGHALAGALRELNQQKLHQVVGQQRLQQAGLHALAPPRALARDQRRDDALHRSLRRRVDGDRNGRVARPPAPELPLEGQHPAAARRDDALVAGVLSVGAPRPPTADRAVHQRGTKRQGLLRVHAPALRAAGWPRDDQHVGAFDQWPQRVTPLGSRKVQHRAALAPQPQGAGGQAPETVASGRLDLDHVGSEVGQDHGREAAGRTRTQVQDADSIEHLCHERPPEPRHDTRARRSRPPSPPSPGDSRPSGSRARGKPPPAAARLASGPFATGESG